MSDRFRTSIATMLIMAAFLALAGTQPARAMELPVSVPMAPGAFNKTGPSNGSKVGLPNVPVSWTASSGALYYQYCIDYGSPCSNWTSIGSNTSMTLSGLAANMTYYWQIRAVDSVGAITYADGSNTDWYFITGAGAFNKSSPSNGATGVVIKGLSWTASAGVSYYEYCYATTSPCSNWTSAGSSTNVTVYFLAADTPYYWQVRATGSAGGTTYADGSHSAEWHFTTGHAPETFAKSGPTNGATGVALSPTLSWGSSYGALSYSYCYGTTNPCSTWTNVGTNTSVTLSGLTQGTTYYWEIRADNGFGSTYANGSNSDWSFTTGSIPTLFYRSAPANGATSVVLNPTLSWTASSGVSTYYYCYGTTNPCSNWASAGTNTNVQLNGLSQGLTYYWEIRADNSFGSRYADNSNTDWSFTTGSKPGDFNKTAPANSATGVGPSPTLTWTASSGVSTYYYCYSTTNPCSNWITAGTNTSVQLSGLSESTTYYWEVRATNAFGTVYADGSNTDWSFATGGGPSDFDKTAPTNGATSVALSPSLSWTVSLRATSYDYCYGTTNPCSNWTPAGANTSVQLSGLTTATRYYWEVRANNSFGTKYADGSNTDWSFTTGKEPGAFSKSTPTDGATGVALNPTLSWQSSNGATSYAYCYGTANPCSNWTSAGTNMSAALSGLTLGTTYYWQVRATNSFGTTYANGDNADWSFATGSKPGDFNKSAPTNGSVVWSPSPTLTWTASSGVSTYYYCYGTTNPCSNWTSAGANPSVTLSGLSPSTTYYWGVRATNSFGTTYADLANTDWSFTTGHGPGAFNKSTPANGATGVLPNVTLQWSASAHANSYSYCYGKANPCSNWTSAGTNTSVKLSGLSLNTIYYWEVRATNSFGNTFANGSNTDWSFRTVVPRTLTLTSIAAQDGTVMESGEYTNVGSDLCSTCPTVKVGDDALNRQFRAILSFRTNNLPPSAVISSVKLQVMKYGVEGVDPFSSLGNIVIDVRTGAFGGDATLQISDFQAAPTQTAAITIKNNPQGSWYWGTLSSASFGLINRLDVTQFRLRFTIDDNNDRTVNVLRFYSGNYSTTTSRPMLVIQYYVP